ncbi:MAG: glycosyltransferase, partial [Cyclobacteriaceae bacterium]
FCFPSLAEGFGLPPLEALACGVPVVASNRTSIPEICGDAAVYFDPERPDDIAEKINLILADQKLYEQKKAEALRQAKKFNWGESATRLLSFLNKHKRG